MSAVSPKQYGFMASHMNPGAIGGPSPAVAKEFVKKTPPNKRKKFAEILAKNRKKKVIDTDSDYA